MKPKDVENYMIAGEIANSNEIMYLFELDLDISRRQELGLSERRFYQKQIGKRIGNIMRGRVKGLLRKIVGGGK